MFHKLNISSILQKFSIFGLSLVASAQICAVEIPGGNMEGGTGEWMAENNAILLQDTKVAKEGSASLCLQSDDAAGKDRKAVLRFPINGEKGFTFTGFIKAAGEGEGFGGALGVMALKGNNPVGGWQHVSNIYNYDWKNFTKEINLPDGSDKVMIILTLNGKGKIWLDGLSGGTESTNSGSISLPQEDISRFNGPTPTISHIGLVQSNALCVEIREFKHIWGELIKYKKQDGDKIVNGKIHKDGEVFERMLHRNGKKVGLVVGPENNLHLQSKKMSFTGKPLHRNNALKPETWTLTDSNGTAIKPKKVALKQKPLGGAGKQVRDNWYVLYFDKALKAGSTYTLDVGQHDISKAFTFDPKHMRSEAVHASHIGYRPSDSAKIAFVSYWSGTAGGMTYTDGTAFSLLDAKTRKSVFDGRIKAHIRKSTKSYGTHAKGRNYALSDVFICDFSAFNKPGEYVVYVDGIGCSYPFPINRQAWTTATRVSLRGFFHQRASQEWKAPWADWDQPRAFHPDNGEDYWEMSMSQLDIYAKEGKRHEDVMSSGKFEEWKTGKKVKNAWGGYYDAGDYDRHTGHLICSRNMLELMELFPDYYKSVKLPIPEDGNDLPDLFDEALWAVDFYKRMQREDGAIYGGIETNGHPKPGEAAFLDSLRRYVFAPDPRGTWRYVASAARAAYVFKQLGKSAKADDYLKSALRAMDWAEKEYASKKAYFEKMKGWWRIKDARNLAAVALYRMTSDKKFNDIFEATAVFKEKPVVTQWNVGTQEEAAFIYARLSDDLANPAIKKNAIAGIEATAQKQITYSDGTCFLWSGPSGDPGFPLILSINAAPQGISLCRAFHLTKNEKYLNYAQRTSLFSVGANPQNMTHTTGLGHKSPEFPLQCTRYYMHTKKPYTGYTVYGINKMGKAPSWVSQWFVTQHNSAPNMDTWPIAESYWDVETWPMVNENTVQQSMAPAVYVWGFLAGRK